MKRLAVGHHNVEFIAADLARTPLQEALAGSAYRPESGSLFILEGLLMYLGEAEVAALFVALSRLQRAPGRVVFTVMEPAPGGRFAFHNATPLVNRLLALWSEPFRSALPRDGLPAFLAPFGLELRSLAAAEDLRRRYLATPLALTQGELIVDAARP